LYDAVANNNFVQYSEDPYSVGPQITGSFAIFSRFNLFNNQYENIYGLNLLDNVNYEAEFTPYSTGEFTIGFWMNTTVALGYVRHAVTRVKTAKTAPVFAKAEKSTVDNQEVFEMGTFIIVEEAYSETQNQLLLMLTEDGVTVSNSIRSTAYTPGLHHYLVTYDDTNGRARIDVDGSFGTWQTATTSLNSSTSSLKINSINPTYTAHQATGRSTILRDLYFKNEVSSDETEAIRNVNFGLDYVTDADLVDTEFADFAFSFTQPNTIATTSIIVNGSNIYLGRSNGEILKGEQPIWDNDFTFDTEEKNASLVIGPNTIYFGSSEQVLVNGTMMTASAAQSLGYGTVEYGDDGFTITGGTIRI